MVKSNLLVSESRLLEELQILSGIAEDKKLFDAYDFLCKFTGNVPDRIEWVENYRERNGCGLIEAAKEYKRRFSISLWSVR